MTETKIVRLRGAKRTVIVQDKYPLRTLKRKQKQEEKKAKKERRKEKRLIKKHKESNSQFDNFVYLRAYQVTNARDAIVQIGIQRRVVKIMEYRTLRWTATCPRSLLYGLLTVLTVEIPETESVNIACGMEYLKWAYDVGCFLRPEQLHPDDRPNADLLMAIRKFRERSRQNVKVETINAELVKGFLYRIEVKSKEYKPLKHATNLDELRTGKTPTARYILRVKPPSSSQDPSQLEQEPDESTH